MSEFEQLNAVLRFADTVNTENTKHYPMLMLYAGLSMPADDGNEYLITARCTLVQSAVLRSHVVCLSVCLSVRNVEVL